MPLLTIAAEKKATSIMYPERVFVALGIHYAMPMRHIVICGLSGSTILYYLISQTHGFRGEKIVI